MKLLYLECNMGAAGDMLAAALLELLPEPEQFWESVRRISLPGVETTAHPVEKCGIAGTAVDVLIHGDTEGTVNRDLMQKHDLHFSDIRKILGSANLPPKVLHDTLAVYQLLAQAESHVHGIPVEQVHFHEVGMLDAIADIVHVCLLLYLLAPDKIVVSPVNVGSGQVCCQHGILPVPAPATAYLLCGIPTYSNDIRGELCTPTGAALLSYFGTEFGEQPVMNVEQIGYGMGKKDFPVVNCVRAFWGESFDNMLNMDIVMELSCNLDDMTPEAIAFATEILFKEGALDVFTTPVYMKKNRPAIMLTCLCRSEKKDYMTELLFKHTSTLGVREKLCYRSVLKRKEETVETKWGSMRVKCSEGYGVRRYKAEFDDLEIIAQKENLSLQEVSEEVDRQIRKKSLNWS